MVKFDPAQLRALMERPRSIRNMAVLSPADQARSDVIRPLVANAGILSTLESNDSELLEDEIAMCIESRTSIALYHEIPVDEVPDEAMPEDSAGRAFLINLIDTPGNTDSVAEALACLRVSDGCLVLVDCIEGLAPQTQALLRLALTERIRPVMAINRLDAGLLELQLDWEYFYIDFNRQIERVNEIITMYHDDVMGDLTVAPERGSVAFSAGGHAWGFTLAQFARIYGRKFGVPEDKMLQRLWGDNYFLPFEKKWTMAGDPQFRAFNLFILDPIGKIFSVCMNDQVQRPTP